MGDGTLAQEALLDFAKQGFDLWSEYLGSNILVVNIVNCRHIDCRFEPGL